MNGSSTTRARNDLGEKSEADARSSLREEPATEARSSLRDAPARDELTDFREKFTAALTHTYRGKKADKEVRYVVIEGTYPADIGGVTYTTVFPRESLTARGELVAAPHLLTAPGRVLVTELDAREPTEKGAPSEFRLFTQTIHNDAWHLRAIAPQGFVRTDFAEMSWFGISDLTNTTPVPMFPELARAPGGASGVRMLLSYDAGRPVEVSPKSLSVQTPIGKAREYHAAMGSLFSPMAMTTGHPVFDPEFPGGKPQLLYTNLVPRVSTMMTPDVAIAADLYLVTWDGRERPNEPTRVHVDGKPVVMTQASAHQLCLTEHYLVIMQSSLVLDTASLARPLEPFVKKWAEGNLPWPVRLPLALLDKVLMRYLKPAAQPPEMTLFVIAKTAIAEAVARGGKGAIEAKKIVLHWEATHALADYDDAGGRITLFAQQNIGADAAQPLVRGDELLDGAPIDPSLTGMFSASTDLNQVRKHVIDIASGNVTTTAYPDPASTSDFPYGLNLLPPVDIHPYRARGGDFDLLTCTRRWERTFWVAAGWTPATEVKRVFEMYERARPESERLTPLADYLARSEDPRNTVRLFALDHDLKRVDQHVLPPGTMIGAPVWVPKKRARSTSEGYLVTQAWSATERHMEVWIYDAGALAKGPVCKLGPRDPMNRMRPGFPLHAAWIDRPSVDAWRPGAYRVPAVEIPMVLEVGELATVGATIVYRLVQQTLESLLP